MQVDSGFGGEFVQNGRQRLRVPLREQHWRRKSPVQQRQCATAARRLGAVLEKTGRQVAKRVGSPSPVDLEESSNRLDIVHCRHEWMLYIILGRGALGRDYRDDD